MEMSTRIRCLRALVLCLGVSLASPPAVAQPATKPDDSAEARTRYKKGMDLYEEGAFDAALTELQRAYDLAPSYKILYNVALVYMQLNDFAGALRNFRKYLDDGGKKIDQKRRADVEKEIAKLQSRVANIELSVNVEGAEVTVDDLDVGETPLDAPLVVNAGKRKIGVSKSGYVPANKVVVVAGGDKKKLALELRPGNAPAATPGPAPSSGGATPSKTTPTQSGPAPKGRKVPWLWWGVTGGLAAGTAVVGVVTLGAQKDLDDKKAHPADRQSLDDAANKTRTLAIVTDVLLVGTVAVGGYATYRTFFAKPSDATQDRARLSLGVGPGRVELSGSF